MHTSHITSNSCEFVPILSSNISVVEKSIDYVRSDFHQMKVAYKSRGLSSSDDVPK
jgi:hypothetical protein